MSNGSATTRQRVIYEARELWRNGYITFDSETTGLEAEDEIIQWAVCDQEGNVLGEQLHQADGPNQRRRVLQSHGIRDEQARRRAIIC